MLHGPLACHHAQDLRLLQRGWSVRRHLSRSGVVVGAADLPHLNDACPSTLLAIALQLVQQRLRKPAGRHLGCSVVVDSDRHADSLHLCGVILQGRRRVGCIQIQNGLRGILHRFVASVALIWRTLRGFFGLYHVKEEVLAADVLAADDLPDAIVIERLGCLVRLLGCLLV